MAGPFLYADRVKDSTTTTGTGDITLSGTAPTGYQSFNTAFGTSTYFIYVISSSSGAEWEVGEGYLSTSTNLKRDNVLASSNSGSAVNFSAGTKDVYCSIAAFDAQRMYTHGRSYAGTRGMMMP
jgi:hypothetical protein